MIDGTLRFVAILACGLVAAGFVLFALDELSGASQRQQAAVSDSRAAVQTSREPDRSGLRGVVDDSSDLLLSPFAGVSASSNPWVAEGVPTLLALLLYGLGLGFLARWLRSRA